MPRVETVLPATPILELVESPDVVSTNDIGIVGVSSLPFNPPPAVGNFYDTTLAWGNPQVLGNGVWAQRFTTAAATPAGREAARFTIPINRDLAAAPALPVSQLNRRYTWEYVAWRDALTAASEFEHSIVTRNTIKPLGAGVDTFNQGYGVSSLDTRNAGRWTLRRRLTTGTASVDVLDLGLSALVPRKFTWQYDVTPVRRQLQLSVDGVVVFSTSAGGDFPPAVVGAFSLGNNIFRLGFVLNGAIGATASLAGTRYRIDGL